MTHRATRDVVRRVMPLLEQLATTTIDRARLLQYLSAMASVDWQIMDVVAIVATPESAPGRTITLRDRVSGAEHTVNRPAFLDPDLDRLAREEYKRLAVGHPLTSMSPELFARFYEKSWCARCRWRGAEFEAFHRECWFAARPVNFEPVFLDEEPGAKSDSAW